MTDHLDKIRALLAAFEARDFSRGGSHGLLIDGLDHLRWCVAEVERLRDDREFACEEPPAGCECPGCSLARAQFGKDPTP